MPSDGHTRSTWVDGGLLSPLTVAHDEQVTDAAILGALIEVEVALAQAYAAMGAAPAATAAAIASACDDLGLSVEEVAAASVPDGNPVIPLVKALRDRVPADAREWVHRGATSQDVLDSALMLVAHRATATVLDSLARLTTALATFAATHRDQVAAARTLTQHAVPTTVGLRAAGWLRGAARALDRLAAVRGELPAQLAGAGGTLASFVQIAGTDAAAALPAAFAAELGLATPSAPWHTVRWPVTELGDALVQAIDAVGVIAADVATLSRTEIGELAEAQGGGSSAMPQKQNPAASVLIRSAALRAPQLAATLHLAAAFAVDERPDGAWHAEWPTLRELLRLALGATARAVTLVESLRVDEAAVAGNLARTHGLIVAERLSLVLGPEIGGDRVAALVAAASAGRDLAAEIAGVPEVAALAASRGLTPEAFAADLLDPARYTGLAGRLVDETLTAVSPAAADGPGDVPMEQENA